MSTGGVKPRGSLVQEATTKEGPRGALDGVGTVRSRGLRAEFGDRPRGSPNLRDSMVGLREAHGRHILEDGPRGSLEKNGVGFREAPVKTVAAALTTQRGELNPWRFAFLVGTQHRQYEVNTVKFDHLFEEAERDHLKSYDPSGSWTTVPISKAKGKQILNFKCKARFVVRGDQEKRDDTRDTYAATLAARSFRIFIAIAARFNLELKQYDAVNAFVNAILDEEIFMRMAPRYHHHSYDDIVITYKTSHQLEADSVMNQLCAKYKISGGGDLEWFLELLLYEGMTTYKISTQPDVAFAISRLSQFLLNPGPKHHQAADKVLCYLECHRAYALRLEGGEDYSVSTDASFADNTLDHKSSQAYVMTLFGGTIGWQANKQDMVTTSTTEAKLLALAQGVKEGKYVLQLLLELEIYFRTPTLYIFYDNQQTLGLLEKDAPRLQVQKGDIQVHYMPTKDMIANGLTKALSKQEHQKFLNQIGVEDINSYLTPQQKDMENLDIEELLSLNDVPDNL
ncbi:conserved hypothetical protein [Talaromyces stipitatus ATCC 10500]|uniref:Reverse transcriptase Ty1/copia-type domain-containing protein n=1 Tax=Talaromyces stipitatus (strain ATCC 10500 / CBS 375.48 / QM 6759 / NRRL 1006) TaxID=441959 RepID=B8MJ42_TALSN|nr:uncharacterized protein TSTA_051400 [Talaromyces stipitatus ATCC 10500]EED15704.1 conserved hypothetical protein [Talaromyces stipitatus ATCC 10500]